MSAIKNVGSVTMPAGEYYVGDPCYAVPDHLWMEWLEGAGYMENPRYLVADVKGQPVIGVGTAYGDGSYLDGAGKIYPVDAGLIGAVPVSLAEEVPTGMHRFTFHSPFDVSYVDGTIFIGSIAIDTDPQEWEL